MIIDLRVIYNIYRYQPPSEFTSNFFSELLAFSLQTTGVARDLDSSDATKISTVFCFFVNKLTQTSNIISSKN